MMITQHIIDEFLRQKKDKSLYHREQKDLEFKESFNLSGLSEYFRDFAGFANNSGGYIIFGVTNSPRKLVGLKSKSLQQFQLIDEEKISGFLIEHFSPYIDWELGVITFKRKKFGVLYAHKANLKPVICKTGDDRQILKNGEIYYRYAGRTGVIEFSELSRIIENRISENNKEWINKVKKIGEIGITNVGLFDTKNGILENNQTTLLLDKDLIKEIDFIKEGEFSESKGSKTLKLIGSVQPIDTVEIASIRKQRLTDEYPYSYTKLEGIILSKSKRPIKKDMIHKIIKEKDVKKDLRYSAYNFRNKDLEDAYKSSGNASSGTPSLYNDKAVDLILNSL